jgi:hypothetical protein
VNKNLLEEHIDENHAQVRVLLSSNSLSIYNHKGLEFLKYNNNNLELNSLKFTELPGVPKRSTPV